MVDPGGGRRRHLHAAARRHDRERRPPRHPAGVRSLAVRPAVGDRRLRADARRAPAHGRLARRPLRAPPAVLDRHRRLHARLAAVRPGRRIDVPQPQPGVPGHRRRDHVRHRPGDHRQRLPRARPRRRLRRLRRGHRRRRRGRPGDRRRAHQRALVALDLPGQHPGGRGGADHHPARGRRVERPEPAPGRLPRPRHLQPRPRRAGVRADPLQRRRLELDDRHRLADRRGRPAGRVRRGRGPAEAADVRPLAVPQADVRRRSDRRVRGQRLAVQPVSLPGDLHAGRAGPVGDRDRRALPRAVGPDLRHGGDRRAADREGADCAS